MSLAELIAEGRKISPKDDHAGWTRFVSKATAVISACHSKVLPEFQKAARYTSYEDDETIRGRLLGFLEGLASLPDGGPGFRTVDLRRS